MERLVFQGWERLVFLTSAPADHFSSAFFTGTGHGGMLSTIWPLVSDHGRHNIKTRFWLLRSLPCYFGLLQMGANHNFHKCTTFPEKIFQVIPVLRSQKVGFCHKKLLFLLLQTHLYRYGALPCYFMPLRVGKTSFGTQTTPSPQ